MQNSSCMFRMSTSSKMIKDDKESKYGTLGAKKGGKNGIGTTLDYNWKSMERWVRKNNKCW